MQQMNLSEAELIANLTFDTYALALKAALDRIGIAMTRTLFGNHELAAWWLVAPLKHAVKAEDDWVLMTRKGRQNSKKIIGFSNWLKKIIKKDTYIGDEFSFR